MKKHLLIGIVLSGFMIGCGPDQELVPAPHELAACIKMPDSGVSSLEEIQFHSCSQNAVYWYWNFGDGYSSTDENPLHTYQKGGTYTVTLSVDDGEMEKMTAKTIEVAETPVFHHPATTIAHDSVWVKGLHIVEGTISVDGANLTIEPGAVVKFNHGGDKRIEVGMKGSRPASITAEGTEDLPILFTSARSDSWRSWGAIAIGPEASKVSSLQYATLEYGGQTHEYNRPSAPVELLGGTVKMSDCLVKNPINKYGIYLSEQASFTAFENNTIDLDPENAYVMHIDADHLASIGTGNSFVGKGIEISHTDITSDVTMVPYEIPYYVHAIRAGNIPQNTLTITEGTRILFLGGGEILSPLGAEDGTSVKLIMQGSATNPVKLEAAAGTYWYGISLDKYFSPESYMDYVEISGVSASAAAWGGTISVNSTTLNMTNCRIEGDMTYAIELDRDAVIGRFENNFLGKHRSYTMYVHGKHLNNFPVGNTFEVSEDSKTGIYVSYLSVNNETYNIAEDMTITDPGVPYFLPISLTLGNNSRPDSGPTLTIEAGARLLFEERQALFIGVEEDTYYQEHVDATLIINGTAENPVFFGTIPGEESWSGIHLMPATNSASSLNNVIVENGLEQNVRFVYKEGVNSTVGPTIANSIFRKAGQYPIYVRKGATPVIEGNNVYEGNGQDIVFYEN